MNGLYLDIGTQTTLWLIGSVDNGRVYAIKRGYWTNNFGLSSNHQGLIPTQLLEDELHRILTLIQTNETDAYELCKNGLIVGTAALRKSSNGADWLDLVQSTCGIQCRLLTPEEEATATWVGAHSREVETISDKELIVDLGGGSTEFIWSEFHKIVSYSIPIGASVLTKYFDRDPLMEVAVLELNHLYSQPLRQLYSMIPTVQFPKIVGGTSVAFTSLLQGGIVDDPLGEKHPIFTKEIFNSLYLQLVTKNESERKNISGIPFDRIKVLPSGATLLKLFIDFFGWKGFQVEPRGVLFGLPLLRKHYIV